jgi:glucose/mannose transport system substrate-binding protein
MPDGAQVLTPDTSSQIEDLLVEFWNDTSISPADAQAQYAQIIAQAD